MHCWRKKRARRTSSSTRTFCPYPLVRVGIGRATLTQQRATELQSGEMASWRKEVCAKYANTRGFHKSMLVSPKRYHLTVWKKQSVVGFWNAFVSFCMAAVNVAIAIRFNGQKSHHTAGRVVATSLWCRGYTIIGEVALMRVYFEKTLPRSVDSKAWALFRPIIATSVCCLPSRFSKAMPKCASNEWRVCWLNSLKKRNWQQSASLMWSNGIWHCSMQDIGEEIEWIVIFFFSNQSLSNSECCKDVAKSLDGTEMLANYMDYEFGLCRLGAIHLSVQTKKKNWRISPIIIHRLSFFSETFWRRSIQRILQTRNSNFVTLRGQRKIKINARTEQG